MNVNLYSTFREIAGIKSFNIILPPDSTVKEAIHEIIRLYPSLCRPWLDESDQLRIHVHVCINKTDVLALPHGHDTKIIDDDILDIFPPITGG